MIVMIKCCSLLVYLSLFLCSTAKTIPIDCQEIYEMGITTDGVYTIFPKESRRGFKVFCDMTSARGGWTVIQKRIDGSEDFFRDWDDYVNGFGDVNGEYWIGNDHLSELTSQDSYRLRIDMEDWTGQWKYAVYSGFRVGDHLSKYQLDYGQYNGTAGDALANQKGMPFSTRDTAGDTNCANRFKGAWWYNNCHHSNLNGLYSNTEFGKGINWKQWHGHTYSLKTTEMKIRRE